jgi:hypothetical protein
MNRQVRRETTAIVFAATFQAACGNSPISPDPLALPALAGRYTLTITAAAECAVDGGDGSLPEPARVRRYTADVQQDGQRLGLTLSSPTLPRAVTSAGIWTNGEYVSFDFSWQDDGFPQMADLLESGTGFFVEGVASISIDVDRPEGWFHGRLSLVQGSNTWLPPIASCYSTRHRFVMSRQVTTTRDG